MLKMKMYPAQNGDAFLLSSDGTNVLIDALCVIMTRKCKPSEQHPYKAL